METLERLDAEQQTATPDPSVTSRDRRLVTALKALNPAYEESEYQYDVLAEQQGISLDEARHKHRDVQLMAEGGLEIGLFDHQAVITLPYWDSLDADSLAVAIGEASKVISQETGWRLYDPQLERFIDPAADAQEFRTAFDYGRDHLRRVVAEQDQRSATSPKKSRWSRLLGRD